MGLKHVLVALAAVLSLSGEAAAQAEVAAPNPVTAHFRAYRAALEAGDLAAAEAEADAALTASIARDGDGGSTAVLAINLAQARLAVGQRAAAEEPAQRAYAIASAGGSNLDPVLAQLVLGRAELTEEHGREGIERLARAIHDARETPELNTETYVAAADLGRWLISQGQYDEASRAWTTASALVASAPGDLDYARAEAHVGKAVSQAADTMSDVLLQHQRPTDTRLGGDPSDELERADEELAQAEQLMAPYAYVLGDGHGMTLGQSMYANALAWRVLMRAFLQSRGMRALPVIDWSEPAPSNDLRPACELEIVNDPEPDFPPGARSSLAVGSVIIRFVADEQGQLIDTAVAAAVPDRWFRDSVERVAPQWHLERRSDSPADCRYPSVMYQSYKFYFN